MSKKKILIVDDSKPVRQQVANALVPAGFEIIEAEDGVAGADAIAAQSLDLVICDVGMPRMNGLEMVEKVKADPTNQDLPIIMLTAVGTPAQVSRAKQLGAKGWIVKPF